MGSHTDTYYNYTHTHILDHLYLRVSASTFTLTFVLEASVLLWVPAALTTKKIDSSVSPTFSFFSLCVYVVLE